MEQPHYTPQQWDMTHRIMDLVDDQRHRSNAPWSDEDTRKVVALVQRTYQSQGLEVDQALIDKALAISLKSLPTQAVAHTTGPSPVDDARAQVQIVNSHTPLSTAELAHRIQGMAQDLAKERQRRTAIKGAQFLLGGALGLAFFSTVIFSRSLLVLPVALVAFWLAWGASTRRFVDNQIRLGDIQRLLDCKEQALGALDRGLYSEERLTRWMRAVVPAVGYYSIKPLASTSSLWPLAAQAAEKDADLFKAWGRWLVGSAPLRECDAMLMVEAGDKVDLAQRFLHREREEMQAQQAAKQQFLNHHNTPGAH